MADWLVREWDDLCFPCDNPQQCIRRAKNSYYAQYGAGRPFQTAFTDHLPGDLKNRFTDKFAIVKLQNQQVDEASWRTWQAKSQPKKMSAIAKFLYSSVRSKFTHESRRSFFPSTPVKYLLATRYETLVSLASPDEENLIVLLQEAIRSLVKQYLLSVPVAH